MVVTNFFPLPNEEGYGLEQDYCIEVEGDKEVLEQEPEDKFSVPVESLFARMGAKSQLRSWLVQNFPDTHTYVEPFCGSAKVILWKTRRARVEIINDVDADMMAFLRYVVFDPDRLVEAINALPCHEALHYGMREALKTRSFKGLERAIAFYLGSQSAFNAKGDYVAYAGSPHVLLDLSVDRKQVLKVAERLKKVNIWSTNYDRLIRMCNKQLPADRYPPGGVFFYLDPPYWNTSGYKTFQGESSFRWPDQVKLAELCAEIHQAGNRFIQTNSYHDDLLKLYGTFRLPDGSPMFIMESREVYYSIGAITEDRIDTKEVIISNFPLAKQRDINQRQKSLFGGLNGQV